METTDVVLFTCITQVPSSHTMTGEHLLICGTIEDPARLVLQDPRVLDAMLPYYVSYYGNPHSRTHAYGWESEAAVEKAREVMQ